MSYHESRVSTADGRVLEYATLGDPAGRTVFFHHGTPGSAPLVREFEEIATASGLFFVTTSRAGYGNSTRDEGRTVASVVDDVRLALDVLGRDRYISVGWSGGGPHSLACAALDAPRCIAAWSLAGVVPIDADFDWTEGMSPENVEEFALSKIGGPEYEAHMAKEGAKFATANAENIIELFGGLLSEVDKQALAGEASRKALADACRHGFANGYWGFFDDDRVFFSPWGFDVSDIKVPVAVWYGDEDLMVPPTHGAWLVEHIAGATVTHEPLEGHVSILSRYLDELAAQFEKAFE